MRIAAIADIHLGNHKRFGGPAERSLNRRCRDTLVVLERAYQCASDERCSLMLMLGDLFDYVTPEAQLIGEVLRLVHAARADMGIATILLVGNHDQQSDEPGDHALAPFAPFADEATVVGDPAVMALGDVDLVFVPHSAAAPAPERIRRALEGLPKSGRRRVLAMHVGVSDDTTAPFLKGSPDSVDVKALGKLLPGANVGAVLAGNWHSRGEWSEGGASVVQVGALVPTGWDNPGLDGYGGVALLDATAEGLSVRVRTLEGPRFVAVRGLKDLDALLEQSEVPKDRRLYARVTVPPEEMAEATKRVARAHGKGVLAAGEVLVESADRVVEARKAASAARSAGTLATALDGFVSAMPLDEGVERSVVMDRCRGYLKAGT